MSGSRSRVDGPVLSPGGNMRRMKLVSISVAAVVLLAAAALALGTVTRASAAAPNRTFTRDVAPILYKNCVVCHRPEEAAPMSLLTYNDARPWAKSIREQVAARRMPPWHADG